MSWNLTERRPPCLLKVFRSPWECTSGALGSNRVTNSHCLMGLRFCCPFTTTSLCVHIASASALTSESEFCTYQRHCLSLRKYHPPSILSRSMFSITAPKLCFLPAALGSGSTVNDCFEAMMGVHRSRFLDWIKHPLYVPHLYTGI